MTSRLLLALADAGSDCAISRRLSCHAMPHGDQPRQMRMRITDENGHIMGVKVNVLVCPDEPFDKTSDILGVTAIWGFMAIVSNIQT